MNYLLDTNILLTYIRDNEIARRLEGNLNLLSAKHNLILSVVSIGELRSIAIQANWGVRKFRQMERILSDFLIADIHSEDILARYAEIDAFSQGKLQGKEHGFSARNMGKNDLWIAATASVLEATLLTTDWDFEHLDQHFLQLQLIKLADFKS
jgi:predicted nucleic acid-binding protein